MKKTKQEESVNTQEPSTPATATANTTETPSQSSGTTSVDLSEFKCPVCGAKHTQFRGEGDGAYCGPCGTNLTWAKTSPKFAPMLKEWLSKHTKSKMYHPSTPACKHKHITRDGVETECGSLDWVHDGERLLYCGRCGSNYRGAQPEDVAEVIAKNGGRPITDTSRQNPGPITPDQIIALRDAARAK